MLLQAQLLTLLDKVLNQSARIRKGTEAIYHCPFCNHYKKKLEVNTVTQEWHCWVCNAAGKSIRSLFRKLKVNRAYYAELYKIVGSPSYQKHQETDYKQQELSLPEGFVSLSHPVKSLEYGNAISYLRSRGVTRDDILRYNIGYSGYGEFKQRIIIPSYDKDGNLNFFSSRVYYDGGDAIKYKNPSWSKDIIGFELFVNWDEPITLVEGAFDAFAIRRNVIPLFGTLMSNKLKEAIVENGVGQVNIVLDNDAMKKALDISDFLEKQEVESRIIKLEDKDPSVLGYERITEIINNSKPMDFSGMILLKMNS